ncbi:MAG: SDR family NAD(P)-dependent oxidoreductase, partial [Myxococcota bacterium]|nr:SDR family NAD(P)-dependent oxidoreductase [Myxococcota bacterium]
MLLDRFRMDGKVAVVTGAGRGIGRGCALAFAEAGAHIVCAARTAEQVEDTAAEAERLGVESLAVLCDVSDADQRQNLIEQAMERFGRIDALVNNAGGSPPRPALDTSDAMFARSFDFNVTTAFSLTRLAVPHMLSGDGGSVVNISSAAG